MSHTLYPYTAQTELHDALRAPTVSATVPWATSYSTCQTKAKGMRPIPHVWFWRAYGRCIFVFGVDVRFCFWPPLRRATHCNFARGSDRFVFVMLGLVVPMAAWHQ